MASENREELRSVYQNTEGTPAASFIPAVDKRNIYDENKVFRVCAYCRVSTDNDAQLSSFELQQQHYRQLVGQRPNWNLVHIFADEGISGTSMKNRVQFNDMITRGRAGEFDLIVTKSVSRFARNIVDCIALVRELKNLPHTVGVFFETDNLNTLSEDSELKLSILASFAQEESIKKSESMNWSLRERFKNNKLLTPELYGYRRPRDAAGRFIKYGILEIEENEAHVVRFIYNAFLNGYSIEAIASLLTDLGVRTKLGNTNWNQGTVGYILRNERYCGSVLTWKTFTADIFEHKKKKNNKDRDQYLYTDHHPAIITVEQFEAAQTLLNGRRHGMRGGLHYMQVIDTGIFQGYVPINHHWVGDDPNAYYDASDSVRRVKTQRSIRKAALSAFDLSGYQVVRGQFMTTRSESPCMSIFKDRIAFNTPCGKKLAEFSHVQLLLHPTERKMAIRPCEKNDIFSISWRKSTGVPYLAKSISCPYFLKALFQIMEWNPEYDYRAIGTWIAKGNDCIIIFNLTNALPLAQMEADKARRKRTAVCPEEWGDSFGDEFYDFTLDNDIYYLSPKDLGAGEKCRIADGQTQIDMWSAQELKEGVEKIKGMVVTDE